MLASLSNTNRLTELNEDNIKEVKRVKYASNVHKKEIEKICHTMDKICSSNQPIPIGPCIPFPKLPKWFRQPKCETSLNSSMTNKCNPVKCSDHTPTNICLIMEELQSFVSKLGYNYLPRILFQVKKEASLYHLIEIGKLIATMALPIRCLEAVHLLLYLTHQLATPPTNNRVPPNMLKGPFRVRLNNATAFLKRFPLSFTSSSKTKKHRHIVLGVYYNGLFGTLGLSRSELLMYKPIQYESLIDLIQDFQVSYETIGHQLISVRLGCLFLHYSLNNCINYFPNWNYINLKIPTDMPLQLCNKIQEKIVKFTKEVNSV